MYACCIRSASYTSCDICVYTSSDICVCFIIIIIIRMFRSAASCHWEGTRIAHTHTRFGRWVGREIRTVEAESKESSNSSMTFYAQRPLNSSASQPCLLLHSTPRNLIWERSTASRDSWGHFKNVRQIGTTLAVQSTEKAYNRAWSAVFVPAARGRS